jgi:[ribosomal protein S18]-alanine N-acetyltransferase
MELHTQQKEKNGIHICMSEDYEHMKQCARIMMDIELWQNMGATYEIALQLILEKGKERIVALKDNKVVGFCVLQVYITIGGYIRITAVKPHLQGQGIGRMLHNFTEDRIFRDTPNIFRCVSEHNHLRQQFLLKDGYVIVGELPDYFIPGQTEILMRKTNGPLSDLLLPENNS